MVSVCPVYSPTEEAAQPPMKPPQERKERPGAVTSRLGQAVLTRSLLCSTPGVITSEQSRAARRVGDNKVQAETTRTQPLLLLQMIHE